MKKRFNQKSGISLIAVLMFMLAATTASIVVFKWIGSENFSSGARLKNSEAYQASQSGLEAVQGWLTNKGADAGALIKIFYDNQQKPLRMCLNDNCDGDKNLLGGMSSNREQKYKVYLTGVNITTDKNVYQLKFLSEGTARDSSKYRQVGIFDVEGLYVSNIYNPKPTNAPDIPAFFGGITGNTQGKFSSAIVNGDLRVNGIETNGNLIVTGNMSVMDNGNKYINCKNGSGGDYTRDGDMYVFGYWEARGFIMCGNVYVGGYMTTTSTPKFLKDLYANGGIVNNGGLEVNGNVTLGGDLDAKTTLIPFGGNMILEGTAKIKVEDGSKINVSGSVWSMNDLFSGNNNNDKYGNLNMGGAGKSLIVPTPNATSCAGRTDRNCNNTATHYFQETTTNNFVHYSSLANKQNPPSSKPEGANKLESMAEQIEDCPKPGGGTYKCVPDPLEVPQDIKQLWLEKGRRLDSLVNRGDSANIPKACIRLVKKPENANGNFGSHWLFGDGLSEVPSPTKADYPSWGGSYSNGSYGTGTKYNFARAANDCYAKLLASDPRGILYQNGDNGEKFLALVVNNPSEKSPADGDFFNGNFIFAYTTNMSTSMKLPPTTNNSNVFLYFQEGATGNLPLEESCLGLPTPCKRNYFIFSEKDMSGSSGKATINGAIFLANGSKITNSLPDAKMEFNKELYNALSAAGVINEKKKDPNLNSSSSGGDNRLDEYHIPTTSHLKVKLGSQYASAEEASNPINAEASILVLPRVIYLKPGNDVTSTSALKNYYKVLYLNGAKPPTTENLPYECSPSFPFPEGTRVTCYLTSAATNCGNLCKNHPFNVFVIQGISSSSGTSSSSGNESSSSSGNSVTLTCNGFTSTGIEGTAITAPSLSCSNGASASSITWSPSVNWSNPVPGTYNNIKATADCGPTATGLQSNVCGTLEVASSVTLTCTVNGNAEAGTVVDNARRTLTCSNAATASNIAYTNINWNIPVAGTYNNIKVTADCGTAKNLKADCSGTLTIVGLNCNNLPQYAKPGALGTANRPTTSCSPSGTASGVTWTRPWGNDWTIPNTGGPYTVSVAGTCSSLNFTGVNCGTITQATVTCAPASTTVTRGSTIATPTLSCNNGSSATGATWTNAPANWIASNTVGTNYNITGTAHCSSNTGDAHLRTISFTCPQISVVNLPDCAFQQSWCPKVDWATGIKWGQAFSDTKGACFFFNGANNGNTVPSCNGGSCYINNGDGGYYVYVNNTPTYGISNDGGAKAQPTNCVEQDVYVPTFACANVPTAGTAGTAITAPAVTCDDVAVTSGLNWTNAPNWSNPTQGTYNNVSVSASSGACSGKTATCGGTLVVGVATTYTLACAAVPATGTAGTAITPPAVTCNGSNSTSVQVTSGLTWSNAPNWSGPAQGTYNNISVSTNTGNCNGKSANCSGTLTVAASACAYQASWCGGIAFANVITGSQAGSTTGGNKCVFFQSAGNNMNVNQIGSGMMLNGNPITSGSIHYNPSAINNATKADGGYYLYIPAGGAWYQLDVATTGTPSCGGGSTPSSASGASSASGGGGGGTVTTLSQGGTDYQPGTYNVTASDCSTWGTQLKCRSSSCSVTINGTNYSNNSCNGWCTLLNTMPALPFTMTVNNSVTNLGCGN